MNYSVRAGAAKPVVNPDVVKTFMGSSVPGESCSGSSIFVVTRCSMQLSHQNSPQNRTFPAAASSRES